MTSMEVILLSASINNFVLVNLDRLLALKFPMQYYNKNKSNKSTKIGLAVCWSLAVLPAVPMWTCRDRNQGGWRITKPGCPIAATNWFLMF